MAGQSDESVLLHTGEEGEQFPDSSRDAKPAGKTTGI